MSRRMKNVWLGAIWIAMLTGVVAMALFVAPPWSVVFIIALVLAAFLAGEFVVARG